MEQLVFVVILTVLICSYLFDQILEYLNLKSQGAELTEEGKGIYDEEKYRKSQRYQSEKTKFSFIADTFNIVVILLFLFVDGFSRLDSFVKEITTDVLFVPLLFFGLIGFFYDLIGIPFSIYSIFVIEEKYGFNRTTVKTFILDKIKGYFLGGIIGGGLLILFTWFYYFAGELFWVYMWVTATLFTLFMTMFYTSLIVPLFNKLIPLADGDLRTAIERYSLGVTFNLKNIFLMDGSKRSSKANAYFSGMGGRKTIVLYDTLVKDHSAEEIVAVLAHEVGHYKKKHSLKMTVLSILQTGIILYLLSLFLNIPVFSMALGSQGRSFHFGLIAFTILFSPVSTVLGLGMNYLSRKHEFEADAFAKKTYSGQLLSAALKRLSVNQLSNLTPHPAYVLVHYSHPPLLERMKALE